MDRKRALTIGALAEQFHVPVHRMQYLIKSRHIRPVQRAGHFRIFDETAVKRLSQELGEPEG